MFFFPFFLFRTQHTVFFTLFSFSAESPPRPNAIYSVIVRHKNCTTIEVNCKTVDGITMRVGCNVYAPNDALLALLLFIQLKRFWIWFGWKENTQIFPGSFSFIKWSVMCYVWCRWLYAVVCGVHVLCAFHFDSLFSPCMRCKPWVWLSMETRCTLFSCGFLMLCMAVFFCCCCCCAHDVCLFFVVQPKMFFQVKSFQLLGAAEKKTHKLFHLNLVQAKRRNATKRNTLQGISPLSDAFNIH